MFSAITFDEISGLYVPAFWALMNSKKRQLYDSVFSNLKSLVSNEMKTEIFYGDFETANLLSIEKNFPGSQIKCCYFHLLQWWRTANKMGLKQNNVKFFTRIVIENFKIAVHIKEKTMRSKFLNNVNKVIFEENKLKLDEFQMKQLKQFYKSVMRTYFDDHSYFSKFINHR